MTLSIIYGLFLGLWRRAFGNDGFGIPILRNRAVLHIIGFTACFMVLWYKGSGWITACLCAGILQGLYWAPGHGPAFDLSRGGQPDEKMIKRYKKAFWNKWCEWLVPESAWYGFGYDFLWLAFRYELPALLLAIIARSYPVAFAGGCVALAYAIGWALFDKGKLKRLSGTELAEYVSGFITGFMLVV